MKKQKTDKTNTAIVGLIAGIFVPIIAIIFYYLYTNPVSFPLFLKQIFMGSSYTRVFGVCIVPNFLIYFIYSYQKKTKAAEGVSIATLLYLIFIVVMKYV